MPVTATATATSGGLLPAATRTTGASTAGVALLPTMTGSARQHDATSIMASHMPNSPAFARMTPGLLHEAPQQYPVCFLPHPVLLLLLLLLVYYMHDQHLRS
jgi:hypothetical protein